MKLTLRWVLFAFAALFTLLSFGQKITGTVSDQSGLPLPGVAILIKGTTTGAQTDFSGAYEITASQGQVLEFRYLGFKTVEKTVGSTSVINVTMEEDAQQLGEVVVQGYRTAPKTKSSIASVTLAAEESIQNRPNASFVQTLQGQVPGLNITTTTGQPGANSLVQLRGVNSINGNTEPLFIIDGTPVDEDNFRSLNPQDIESISVLKDAGATAIYGNRGANGVIIIKTKTGSFEQELQINYTGIISVSALQVTDPYDLTTGSQQLLLERELNRGRGATLTDTEIAEAPNFNWLDFFFRQGLTQNHNLTLTSGSSNSTQFTSIGYFVQEGLLAPSNLKRFSFRNNITGKTDNGKFTYGTNVTINFSKNDEPNNIGTGAINRNYVLGAVQSVPYITPDEYQGSQELVETWSFADTPLLLLDRLQTYERVIDELKIVASANASWEFMDNVRANVVLSTDYQNAVTNSLEQPGSWNALFFAPPDPGGIQFGQRARQFTYNQVTSLTYDNAWGKHALNVGAYMEYFKAHFDDFGYRQDGLDPKTVALGDDAGFINDTPADDFNVPTINATRREAGLFSYFGQVDYDYDETFGIVGTIRRDASYRFAESNRYATFYSVAGRVNLDRFLGDNDVVDVLKLRASYGTAGNQRISGGGYFTAPDLTRSLFATGPGYLGANSLFLSQIPNTTLRWETVTQLNVGVDFELFESRIRGSFDVYEKETSDLFQDTPVSAINSVTTLDANTGSLFNRGADLNLAIDAIRSKDLTLTLNLAANYNETELADLPSEEGEIIGIGRNGGKIFEYFEVRYAGVNPANGNLLFLDIDGNLTENPNVDTDRVWLSKNTVPDFQGSFGFNLDWNGFFLQTQFNFAEGVDNFDFDYAGRVDPDDIGQFQSSTDLLRAWTPTNRNTDIPSLRAANIQAVGAGDSDRFIFSGDYIRLRFASLGYNFPGKFLEGTGLKKLSIFANAENIWTLTSWRGLDVEGRTSQQNEYPTPRTISFGIELGI